jgi:hypothetical protein
MSVDVLRKKLEQIAELLSELETLLATPLDEFLRSASELS